MTTPGQTPTLNSLLRQPSAITTSTTQQIGPIAATNVNNSYSPAPNSMVEIPVQQNQPQSDAYHNQQRLAVKGATPGQSYISSHPFQQPPPIPAQNQPLYYGTPSGSSYPQPGIPNRPPYSPRPAAPVASQGHGQFKHNLVGNRDQEPTVNGVPSFGKGLIPIHNDSSGNAGPRHPSVTALRQEATGMSPARNASPSPVSLHAPSSPASMMRQSPVSPTPVSVYNQIGGYHVQPATAPPPAPQHQMPQQPSEGFYDGNSHYPGYVHPTGPKQPGQPVQPAMYGSYQHGPTAGPSNSTQPYYASSMPPSSVGHQSQGPPIYPTPDPLHNQQNAYFGQPMRNVEQMRMSNGPNSGYMGEMTDASRVMPSPAVLDSADAGRDPNRNGNTTPTVDSRPRTATPATPNVRKSRPNGAKDSHPSPPTVPAPSSPGCISTEDMESSLSSPSWPRTPMSPNVKHQPSSMGPPAQPSTSSGSKDSNANVVARLLGDPQQFGCSAQEWNERRAFYERLVQYCESNGHPITAQPTVSKQTVDLFRLYTAVRQRGGFEEVTKKKIWRDLCTMFGIGQSNSASGMLKKQYSKFLFPYECYYDLQGIDPQPIIASLESRKKKAKAAAAAAAAVESPRQGGQQQSGQIVQSFPAPSQPQQPKQYSNEQFMVPPPGSSSTVNTPAPFQSTPANSNAGFPVQHHPLIQPGPQPAAISYPPGPQPSAVSYPPGPQSQPSAIPHQQLSTGPIPPSAAPAGPPASVPSSSSMAPYSQQPRPAMYPDQSMAPVTGDGQSAMPHTVYPTGPLPNHQECALPRPRPPPNQYLSPHAVRYPGPADSAMISHNYRSNMAPTPQYNAGTYAGPPQPNPYTIQSQPADNAVPRLGHPMPPPVQGGPYVVQQPAGYPQIANAPPSSMDYSKIPRVVQVGYQRFPSAPPTIGPGYNGGPPNMSLRPDLAAKVPLGVVQYSHAAVAQSSQMKKEPFPIPPFPPGSVEATAFTLRRRRRLNAKDIGSVEGWRLVMALRSGLPSETTWALNCLTVLLCDDSSALYFGLSKLPGLLETLVEHWRRSLKDTLGDLFNIEEVKEHSDIEPPTVESCENGENSRTADSSTNGETGTGDESRIQYDSELWRIGGGMSTDHLTCAMDAKCDETYLPFSRKRMRCSMGGDTTHPNTKRCRLESSSPDFFFGSHQYEECDEMEERNCPPLRVLPVNLSMALDRSVSISNIIRGLSFIPGNETSMSKHSGLLRVIGELLLTCHTHPDHHRRPFSKSDVKIEAPIENGPVEGKEDTKADGENEESKQVDIEDNFWFLDQLMTMVDDAFVVLCNLSTNLDLYEFHQNVSRPLLDAILHWTVCRSPTADDPLTNGAYVSPKRYAMEILCKLSVQEKNVDLILATPPWDRMEYLLESVSSMLMMGDEAVTREFALVLVHALLNASPVACVAAASKTNAIQNLIMFLEQAEANMHQTVQTHGFQALKDNPDLIGTSVGMLRRAASSLLFMSKYPSCRSKFDRYQQRLLHFTMSPWLDSRVGTTLVETLYELQLTNGPRLQE